MCALPNSIDASSPASGDSPGSGDDQIRAFKLFIEDILSIPDATSITNNGIDYQPDGTIRYPRRQEWSKGANIASATAVTVGLDGNFFHITGVATITSFSSVQAGTVIALEFDDACTTTYNATSLILAGLESQTWAAGDILVLISEGSGNWRELFRKGPLAGRTLNLTATTNQIVFDSDAPVNTGTFTMAVLSAARVWTLPDTTGTFALTANKLSDFAATTSAELAGVISNETGTGLLVFATNPTLTSPTLTTPIISEAAPATPTANILYTDSIVKGWLKTSGGGAWTIDADLNVSSITDNSTGNFTINWATAFADENYAVVGMNRGTTNLILTEDTNTARTTTSVTIVLKNPSGTATDPTVGVSVIVIGNQ